MSGLIKIPTGFIGFNSFSSLIHLRENFSLMTMT